MNTIRRLLKVALLGAALVISHHPLSGLAATTMVGVGNGADVFTPPVANINTGDTVIWVWQSGAFITHSVTSTNSTPAFGTPTAFAAPHSFTNVFSTAGTFAYYCTQHTLQHMTGAVVVASANLPPTVNLTHPSSGAVFAAPANVTIQALASDSDGTVTNVQFRVGLNVVTNKTTAPFSAVTNNLAAGSYTLTAIASDNNGATATNQVTISVVTPVSVLLSAPRPVPPGKFRFTYTANVGLNYVIQSSSNLALSSWTTLVTNLAAGSSINFTDLNATFDQEYYRVGLLPNP